jgi:hypothetical protein
VGQKLEKSECQAINVLWRKEAVEEAKPKAETRPWMTMQEMGFFMTTSQQKFSRTKDEVMRKLPVRVSSSQI